MQLLHCILNTSLLFLPHLLTTVSIQIAAVVFAVLGGFVSRFIWHVVSLCRNGNVGDADAEAPRAAHSEPDHRPKQKDVMLLHVLEGCDLISPDDRARLSLQVRTRGPLNALPVFAPHFNASRPPFKHHSNTISCCSPHALQPRLTTTATRRCC